MEARFNIIDYFKGVYGPEHDFNPIPVMIGILILTIYILLKAKSNNKNAENGGDKDESW